MFRYPHSLYLDKHSENELYQEFNSEIPLFGDDIGVFIIHSLRL